MKNLERRYQVEYDTYEEDMWDYWRDVDSPFESNIICVRNKEDESLSLYCAPKNIFAEIKKWLNANSMRVDALTSLSTGNYISFILDEEELALFLLTFDLAELRMKK